MPDTDTGPDDQSTTEQPAVETRERVFCDEFVPLTEAATSKDGVLPVTVIQPGFNTSKTRFYQPAALARDHKVFEGVKMYLDHQTKADERARPEGSIRDWVANLRNVSVAPSGAIVGEAVIVDPPFQEKVGMLAERKELATIGLSIRAVGDVKDAQIESVKTLSVEGLAAARSVDFVTEPGAGGRVITEADEAREYDLDLVTIQRVKERRPDLVEGLRRELIEEAAPPPKEEPVTENATDQKALEEAKREAEEAKAKLEERDKQFAGLAELAKLQEAKAKTKEAVAKAVADAKLPEPIAERVIARFADVAEADAEAIAAAIREEQDYAKKLVGAGKVRGLGEPGDGEAEAKQKRLTESFQRLGLPEEQAKTAAAVR